MATNIGPLGASLMKEREHVIVGVVGDVKNTSLQGGVEPAIYHSIRQFPFRHLYLVARGADTTRERGDSRGGPARRRRLAAPELRTMESVVGASVERPRLLMYLLGVFATSALALAALGIYGLLSYAVTERQQELSIRMALGARPCGVRWMVVREGLMLAVIGSVVGCPVAYAIARQVASLLYGVPPGDPIALGGVAAVAIGAPRRPASCRRGKRRGSIRSAA